MASRSVEHPDPATTARSSVGIRQATRVGDESDRFDVASSRPVNDISCDPLVHSFLDRPGIGSW